jgi:8-oxo-dGTP pyrophosphatase MutT (NUDIX family)
MNNSYIDKLALIILKNRKVLFARSKDKDAWFSPGGKREEGETDQEALVREIKEELGVDLKPETLEYYETFQAQAHGKPEGTMVKITCYTGQFDGKMSPQSEIDELGWLSSTDKEKTTITGGLILDDLRSKNLID